MARKYECSTGRYAWILEKCEEVIIVAGYDEVCRFIPSDQTWNREFENHFFDHGNGIAFDFLDRINSVRRRRGLDIIVIEETDILDYGRSPDKLMKSEHRRRVRSEISAASVDVRQNLIEAAREAAARLLPPHVTCEEFLQKRRLRQRSDARLSREEVKKRESALLAASGAQTTPAKPSLDVDRVTKMLSLVSDTSIRSEIISTLSADRALEVAERVTDPELRNALVTHSFTLVLRRQQTADTSNPL